MAKMRERIPVVVLVGILVLFLAVSIGVANGKKEKEVMNKNHEREEERQPWRPREREEEEEEEWRGGRRRRHDDPEEREREEERGIRRRRKERSREERGGRRRNNNPYHLRSNRFHTVYRNRNGEIRVLERFDKRSNRLENLQNYRIVQFESRPQTLIFPHHSDADYILVVQQGSATITLVDPARNKNTLQAYNLERGDALRLSSGTTSYLLNRHDSQNLRVLKLAIPVNKPASFDDFYPSSAKGQESYLSGFSKNILEASFNAPYEEIERTLLGNEEEEQESSSSRQESEEDEGVIVRLSKEQIQELSKYAESKRSKHSSESGSGPFNLRSDQPIYSNKFGSFYEITPESNPQLQDLDIALTYTQIKEGALLQPHHNSKAIFIVVVAEGDGNYELVGPKEQSQAQQEEEEEEEEEEEQGIYTVRRYSAKLSRDDTIIIPAGYPLSINASSNLALIGFGINADNNNRNFLTGSEDNVIALLPSQVREIIFPGSAEDSKRLIKKQEQSYFANANPQQQQEEGRRGRRAPLSSILSAFN